MDPSQIISLNPQVVAEVLVSMIILVALFLFFGALAAGIEEVTWGKVLFASVLIILVQWIIAVVLSFIPVIGGLLGFILSILGAIYLMRVTFLVEWPQAFQAIVLAAVAELTVGIVLQIYTDIDVISFVQRLFFVS